MVTNTTLTSTLTTSSFLNLIFSSPRPTPLTSLGPSVTVIDWFHFPICYLRLLNKFLKKIGEPYLQRHASPDMNLNPENTTKMNPFIILLVQNATKCISHSRIMNFPFCKNIAFTISKEQYNIIPHFVYLFCVCQIAILNIVVYFWTFNLPFMASLKNFRPSVGS